MDAIDEAKAAVSAEVGLNRQVERVTELSSRRETLMADVESRQDRVLPLVDERQQIEALANPAIRGSFLGPEAQHTVIAVRTQFMDEADSALVNAHFSAIAAGLFLSEFVTAGIPWAHLIRGEIS